MILLHFVKSLKISKISTLLRLNGEIFIQNQRTIKLETFIWANKSSQSNEIALSLTTKDYNLNDLLKCVYEYKTMVPEWMAVTKAGRYYHL